MKKLSVLLVTVFVIFSLASCSSTEDEQSSSPKPPVSSDVEVTPSESEQSSSTTEETEKEATTDIHQLKDGDNVAIVGQVASSKLVNGNTLWVQVQQEDETFVIYHCQLKDEFITEAEELKTLDVAKVNGLFLSLMDLKQENASPLVTLYDCEIIE